jgi:RNA recognition motif-containing protein
LITNVQLFFTLKHFVLFHNPSQLYRLIIFVTNNNFIFAILVFLSNLDFSVEAEPIERAMSKSGKVIEVRLVRNPVGKSKGFAFVEFATEREAR